MVLDLDNCSKFDVVDSFNNNRLVGFISHGSGHKYGSLLITEVNEKPAPQTIWATPKIVYPYDSEGGFGFINNIENVEIYDKLDGTNILQYMYKDAVGNEYITYKTRQTPVLDMGDGKTFTPLLKKVMDIYPDLNEIWYKNGMNVSYELYGMMNKVSVNYPTPIDIKVLFARGDEFNIIPPTLLDCGTIGHAKLITAVTGKSDLGAKYEEIKQWMEDRNKVKEVSELEMEIDGMEGTVWYCISPQEVKLYKCKPKTIETFAFKVGGGIPSHSLYTTVINAFEDTQDVTYEYVVQLLLEEFKESDIHKKRYMIMRLIDDQKLSRVFFKQVTDEYEKVWDTDKTFDINTDKRRVMNHMANKMEEWKIDKRRSGRIYSVLKARFGRADK
jgi:hypothetical protein